MRHSSSKDFHWRSVVTTMHHVSSVAQSSLDMFAGFSFGATMCGFFIVVDAFSSDMVMGCGGGSRRWDGGEEEAKGVLYAWTGGSAGK
jgi:hypothetical protein